MRLLNLANSTEGLSRQWRERIYAAVQTAKFLIQKRESGETISDFDIRGELYSMAHELAPHARVNEIQTIRAWLVPKRHEVGVDLAAGTGFLTQYLQGWTEVPVYAVDSSIQQLRTLRRNVPDAIPVLGSPDDVRILTNLPDHAADFATSLGGMHHIDDQRQMFANIASVLSSGGRFVFADVCAGTTLARHFDEYVAPKCVTGHTARWLSPAIVRQQISGLPLRVVRMEVLPLVMKFRSDNEMSLFFTGLHAYDVPQEEVISDLREALGVTYGADGATLNWPLLFAHLERI